MLALDPVLVIGGCGGLGFHVVTQLFESGDATAITILDIQTDRNRVDSARYVKGSVSSYDDVSKVLAAVKPRVIFHVASPHLMQQSATPKIFEEVNVLGTKNLLHCISECRHVQALVYTSSTGIIHNGFTDIINATEDVPVYFDHPEPYARTKAQAEQMILEANRHHGLLTLALRCPTLYGEGDNTTIPQIVENAQAGRGKIQVGDGQNMFDYLYLGNAAYAHRLAAKKLLQKDGMEPPSTDAEKVDGEVFIITDDEHWKFWDFVRTVGVAAGCVVQRENVRRLPTWLYYAMAVMAEWIVYLFSLGCRESQINRKMIRFSTMTSTFNINKAKTKLGYRAQWTTQEGIDRAVRMFIESEECRKSL